MAAMIRAFFLVVALLDFFDALRRFAIVRVPFVCD